MIPHIEVRCLFHGDDIRGGAASVQWLGELSRPAMLQAAEQQIAVQSQRNRVSVFVATDGRQYSAESYSTAGRPIRFCGHGALAAAFFVFAEAGSGSTLQFKNDFMAWRATYDPDAAFNVRLRYPRPKLESCSVPDFAQSCLGVTPVAAARAGGDSDYLILELADADRVATLTSNSDAITAATQRALIVTAEHDDGCVYRYFAPQYGEPEDAATGSAAVQLGAFWASRMRRLPFIARQLSATGALARLDCTATQVELAAQVGYG